jgi:fatty acid desaturase
LAEIGSMKTAGPSSRRLAPYRAATVEIHRQLAHPSSLRSLVALLGDWLAIVTSAFVSASHPESSILYMLSYLVIASRQHALLVLMHEGAHGHLFAAPKWNDRVSNWLTAWPFGIQMERYREHHWKHHQFTNTERDPDWGRKVQHSHWQFPKSQGKFWRDFLPYLWGLGLLELWFTFRVIGVNRRFLPGAAIYYAAILAALTFTQGWLFFAKFWLFPLLTLVPALMKVRSVVEHLGLKNDSELSASRNIVGSPLESFFFGPHGNSLHLIHHLFPQIPWHSVKRMREALLKQDSYLAEAIEHRGYFLPFKNSAYRDLTRSMEIRMRRDSEKAA